MLEMKNKTKYILGIKCIKDIVVKRFLTLFLMILLHGAHFSQLPIHIVIVITNVILSKSCEDARFWWLQQN